MIWGAVVCGAASVVSMFLGELFVPSGSSLATSTTLLCKAADIYRLLPFGSLVAFCGREHYLAALDGSRTAGGRHEREARMFILACMWMGSTFYGAVGVHGFATNPFFLVGCSFGSILLGYTLWRMGPALDAVVSA